MVWRPSSTSMRKMGRFGVLRFGIRVVLTTVPMIVAVEPSSMPVKSAPLPYWR